MPKVQEPEVQEKTDRKIELGPKLESETLFESPYYPVSFIFPYNPDPLVRGNDYSIYDEMRDDDQVKVALNLKKSAVLGSGWVVSCEDQEIADFVTENLKNLGLSNSLESSWDEVLSDILNAFDYGFTLSEHIYQSPGKTKSGKWEIKTIKVRPPHSFIFHLEKDGTVREIEQLASSFIKPSIKINPDTLIHYVNDPEFGNPYGTSDLRAAHPAWKAKKFVFRMAMRYAERFASPTVVGRYKQNMGAGEIDRLYNRLQRIQSHTTLVLPEEVVVDFVQSSRDSQDTYEKILNMLNMWIARSILVPDLLGVSGGQSTGGSQALGREQFKVFMQMVERNRRILEQKINIKLVQPMVLINFGDVPCSFSFKPIDFGESQELLKIWVTAVNGGAFKPNPEEVNYLRKGLGFPEGDVVEKPMLDPRLIKNNPELGKAFGTSQSNVLAFRDKTPYEAKFDFERAEKVMDTSENSLVPELMSLVRKMVGDLIDQIKKKKIIENFKPELISKLELPFRREMNQAVKGHFLSLFRESLDQVKEELLPSKLRKFTADDLFPDDFEDILRAESFKLVGDITSRILRKSQDEIISGLRTGASLGDIILAIKESSVTDNENYLITTVRTRTTEVFNAARKTFFDSDPVAQEIVVGYQYSAIIDKSTTRVCRELDTLKFSKENSGDFLARATPPLHFNCRSMWVPITKFEGIEDWDKPKSYEWLESRGAALVQEFQFIPDKVASGHVKGVGNSPVISPSGIGTRIKVKRVSASLITIDEICIVGFRVSDQDDVRYQKTLNRYSQTNEPDLGSEGWILPENTGLMINTSCDSEIAYTCVYEIMDLSGNILA